MTRLSAGTGHLSTRPDDGDDDDDDDDLHQTSGHQTSVRDPHSVVPLSHQRVRLNRDPHYRTKQSLPHHDLLTDEVYLIHATHQERVEVVHVRVLSHGHVEDVEVGDGLSDGLNHPVALRGRPTEAVPGEERRTAVRH